MTFTPGELSQLKATHESHYSDTIIVQTFTSENLDTFGDSVNATYTDGSSISALFSPKGSSERRLQLPEMRVSEFDAVLHLPAGTTITDKDRVKITHRYGVALSPALVYSVTGTPLEGISGTIVALKKVTQ